MYTGLMLEAQSDFSIEQNSPEKYPEEVLEATRLAKSMIPQLENVEELSPDGETTIGKRFSRFLYPVKMILEHGFTGDEMKKKKYRNHPLNTGIMKSYMEYYFIPDGISKKILNSLMKTIDNLRVKPSRSENAWRNKICHEASERSFETLATSYGLHLYEMEAKAKEKSLGETLQTGLARLFIEIAATTANKDEPKFVNVPPSSVDLKAFEIHKQVKQSAVQMFQKLSEGATNWQKKNRKLVSLSKPLTIEHQTHDFLIFTDTILKTVDMPDALTKFINPINTTDHNNPRPDIEHARVTFYHGSKMCDVPVIEILSMDDPNKIIENIRNERAFGQNASYQWYELNKSEQLPHPGHSLIGISIDEAVDHDSDWQRLARTGRVPAHLHFREKKGGQGEIIHNGILTFAHDRIDGLPAQQMALAVAAEIGANEPTTPDEEILWQPSMPRHIETEWNDSKEQPLNNSLTATLLEKKRFFVNQAKKILNLQKYLRDPDSYDQTVAGRIIKNIVLSEDFKDEIDPDRLMADFITDLELSDVELTGTRPESLEKTMNELAQALDTTFLSHYREIITSRVAGLHPSPSEKAKKILINRILLTKITGFKASQLVDEVYWGRVLACGGSYNPEHGVRLFGAPFLDESLHNEVDSLLQKKLDIKTQPLFVDAPQELKSRDKSARQNYPKWIRNRLGMAMENVSSVFGQMYYGFEPILTFNDVSDGELWRLINSQVAGFIDTDLVDPTKPYVQNSQIGKGVQTFDFAEGVKKTGFLKRFTSALAAEPTMHASGGYMQLEDKTSYTLRMRMTPELMRRIDISSPTFRDTILPQVGKQLFPEDEAKQRQVDSLMTEALKIWDESVKTAATTSPSFWDRMADKLKLPMEEVNIESAAMVGSEILRKNPEMLRAVQYLMLGGMLGIKKQYYQASEVIGKRLIEIIKDSS